MSAFERGSWVQKTDGDYSVRGRVVAVIAKYKRDLHSISQADEYRLIVQTEQGMLLVMHERQLKPWEDHP